MRAFDPSATLAVHCGNGIDAGFSPYQSTDLRRSLAVQAIVAPVHEANPSLEWLVERPPTCCRPPMFPLRALCRFSDASNDDFTSTPGWRRRKSGKVHVDELLGASADLGEVWRSRLVGLLPASIRRSTVLPGAPGAVFTSR